MAFLVKICSASNKYNLKMEIFYNFITSTLCGNEQ